MNEWQDDLFGSYVELSSSSPSRTELTQKEYEFEVREWGARRLS